MVFDELVPGRTKLQNFASFNGWEKGPKTQQQQQITSRRHIKKKLNSCGTLDEWHPRQQYTNLSNSIHVT